ncbi:MAG: hypothetical protein K1060chlam3_00104 [Candidatus Anoxychlamydiales bacterium]|nr:hypothetical protein [Candidatus Anoxychlamydiales bacterium]
MKIFKSVILSILFLILLSISCTGCIESGGGGGGNSSGEVDVGINGQFNPDPIVTPVPQ